MPRQWVAALRNAGIDVHRFKPIWKGFTNGRLLAAIERDGFDVLLTNDKNMSSQQNFKSRTVAVVALPTNRRATIISRLADIIDTLGRAAPSQYLAIEQDGSRTAHRIGPDGLTTVEELPRVPPFR